MDDNLFLFFDTETTGVPRNYKAPVSDSNNWPRLVQLGWILTDGTNVCAIRGPYGLKWPKLMELHQKLFGCAFEDAHNAFEDIKATKNCFWEMRRRKLI